MSFESISVWKRVTPELAVELGEFLIRHGVVADAAVAGTRARQAVCIARSADGSIAGVGTAFIRVLPQLRQPMYYYRQFFAPAVRGQGQALPFFNHAREVLQGYSAALRAPEALGLLLELDNAMLVRHFDQPYVAAAESTFIGYSPRGLQLRVSYFEGARLFTPIRLATPQAAAS